LFHMFIKKIFFMLKHKKRVRHLKVHSRYHSRSYNQYRNVPWLNISGVWLEEVGFNIGDGITVSIEANQLIITKPVSNGDTGN